MIAAVILSVYVVGRLLVFYQVKSVIQKELADLEKQGIEIKVENLQVGPWRNRVQLDSVRIKFTEGYKQDNKVQVTLGNITLEGIGLLRAISKKELWIRSVQLSRPFIQTMAQKEEGNKSESVKNSKKPAIKKFFFKYLHIYQGQWKINENTDKPVRITTLDEIHLTDIRIENNVAGPLKWQIGKTTASAVQISVPESMHTYSVKAISYDAGTKRLNIDTVKIIPHYNKTEFPQKAGKELPRLSAVFPYVQIEGCELQNRPQFTFNAKKIRTKMWLESYLDKRQPFLDPADRVLPVAFLQRLPIQVQIDTVQLEDSYAEHEEFPEIGEETGKVFFSKLNVTIRNITTNKITDEKKLPTLSATTMFMGVGDLRAEFGFPATPDGVYYANGALYNFPMTALNKAIMPLARAKVESGDLNSIKFNFQYNDARSDGQSEMNYKNLKVTVFKKDDPDKKAGFANFLLNTFIIKENLDDTVAKEKHLGTIQLYHDRRRGLFYYWWKSVLSGVLATYNIDKVPEPKDRQSEVRKK